VRIGAGLTPVADIAAVLDGALGARDLPGRVVALGRAAPASGIIGR
jgi:hypothetical protein